MKYILCAIQPNSVHFNPHIIRLNKAYFPYNSSALHNLFHSVVLRVLYFFDQNYNLFCFVFPVSYSQNSGKNCEHLAYIRMNNIFKLSLEYVPFSLINVLNLFFVKFIFKIFKFQVVCGNKKNIPDKSIARSAIISSLRHLSFLHLSLHFLSCNRGDCSSSFFSLRLEVSSSACFVEVMLAITVSSSPSVKSSTSKTMYKMASKKVQEETQVPSCDPPGSN